MIEPSWAQGSPMAFAVRLRTSTVPATIRPLIVSRPIPESMVLPKPTLQLLSYEQQAAFDRLRSWVVVVATDEELSAMRADVNVMDVRPLARFSLHNEPLTDDSLSGQQYALQLIGAQEAWKRATGSGILVGILDTGIDWEHPDLQGQLAVRTAEDVNENARFDPWPSTIAVDGIYGDLDGVDNDGNGYVDDVIGFDFVDQSVRNVGDDRQRDAIPFDEQGHGTSVAGVIAAKPNNRIGIAGLAHGARLVALRAFDATGNAEEDDIAAAIVYAVLNNVKVLNYSFGDVVDAPILADAVRFAAAMGCVQISSAGNTGTISQQFPASYPEVCAVAATTQNDTRAPFSSTGTMVTLSAPGQSIITTAVGGRYRTVNGTSFAAPYAAAVAAMLLEQDSTRTPEEVRAKLMTSSIDLGPAGWDAEYGNGRLRADAALTEPGDGVMTILTPRGGSVLDSTDQSMSIEGSAVTPLFQGYQVSVGRGLAPLDWQVAATSSRAVKDSVLGIFDGSGLEADRYTLRLAVEQKDGRILAVHRRLRIASTEPLQFVEVEVVPAWQTDRRIAAVSFSTSQPSMCRVVAIVNQDTLVVTDQMTSGRNHYLPVDVPNYASQCSLFVSCWTPGQEPSVHRVDTVMTVDLGTQAMPLATAWTRPTPAPFAGYVLNDVRDLYSDGGRYFVMSDLSSGGFGSMLTVTREGSAWGYRDSTQDVWIPRAIGDANGNGRLEVFGHVVGQARLFEAAAPGESPFGTIIFSSNDGRRNAAGMADVNGDGRDDLLLLSNEGVEVITYNGSAFERLGLAGNPTPPAPGNADNRVDEISVGVGDFDRDGRIEIAFGDTDGDLIVSEWSGTQFRTEFTVENTGGGGSGYVTAGDVNGDGIPEILHGVPDDPNLGIDQEYGRQLWTWSIYRAERSDVYSRMWQDHFDGVRYGVGYRNGMGLGQLDSLPGNEVIVSVYPRLYVFGWRDNGMQPLLYQDQVATPRVLVYDVDEDGRANLGYGVTVPDVGIMTGFAFTQYAASAGELPTPAGLRARYLDTTTALVHWMPVDGARAYLVQGYNHAAAQWEVADTVQTPPMRTTRFQSNTRWSVRVIALPQESELKQSVPSTAVDLWHRPTATSLIGVVSRHRLSQLRQGLQVRVQYDDDLMESNVDPAVFEIATPDGGQRARARSLVLADDRTYLVSFPRLPWVADRVVLSASQFPDRRGVPTRAASSINIPLDPQPAPDEFYLTALSDVSSREAVVTFSQPVGKSAADAANYILQPVGNVIDAQQVGDDRVRLVFSSTPPLAALGSTYSITARGIVSARGDTITSGAGNTVSFVLTAPTVEDVFVYPHPVRLSNDAEVTFANLTPRAEIEILDQRFNRVIVIQETDANGGATWDLRDREGRRVPPGIYFYRVSGSSEAADQGSGLRKLMIMR